MKKALREAFSDARGKISRRAIALYFMLMLWGATVICNLCNSKIILNPTIENHLYLLISVIIGAIFADGLVNRNKEKSQGPSGT